MSGRLDSVKLESNQQLFLNMALPLMSETGDGLRNLSIGEKNQDELSVVYNNLHNLRHMAYSVGFRPLGEFLNYFERLVRLFQERPQNALKEAEYILLQKCHMVLYQELGKLNQDINSKLDFKLDGEEVLKTIKQYHEIPPVRKMNILTLQINEEQIQSIKDNGFLHTSVSNTEEMFNAIKNSNYDCLIVDLDSDISPTVVLKLKTATDPRLKVIMIKSSLGLSKPEMIKTATKTNLLLEKRLLTDKNSLCNYINIILTELL